MYSDRFLLTLVVALDHFTLSGVNFVLPKLLAKHEPIEYPFDEIRSQTYKPKVNSNRNLRRG